MNRSNSRERFRRQNVLPKPLWTDQIETVISPVTILLSVKPSFTEIRMFLADSTGCNRSRSGNKRGRGLVIKIGFDRSG